MQTSATVFEYCLNFRETNHDSYYYLDEVLVLFEKRAREMRNAIPGSPRWKLGKDTTVDEQVPFRSPFMVRDTLRNYCVMFEAFTRTELEKDIIPMNLFASRRLGTTFYGIVLVFRTVSFMDDPKKSCLDMEFCWNKETELILKDSLVLDCAIQKYSFTSTSAISAAS